MPETKRKPNNKLKIFIWLLVCILVVSYMVFQLYTYFFSTGIRLYQVSEGSSESRYESQYTALILREETVVTSLSSGYVNFLVSDSTPISVNEETYLIDGSGTLYETLSESAASGTVFSEDELLEIKESIYEFDTTFDEKDYSDIYSFKYKLSSQLVDLIYSDAFESSSIDLSAYTIITSDVSGIMVHSTDGYEGISADEMEAAYFRQTNYERNMISSNDYVEAGDAVYKVVTSQEWQLVIQIEDSSVFEDVSSLEIEFLKDGITAEGDFYMYTSAGVTYGVITLDKYMYRYVSDRFIQISLTDEDSVSGLMIPKTSVATKQFYMIPVDFLTTGGSSSSSGFLVQTDDGSVQFVVPDIVKTTDEYVYVSTDFLSQGDVLVQTETNETYTVRIKENLEGVYISENGSYSFAAVDITGENGDFYIVEKSSSSALSLYDNIVQNAESVAE